jgi:phosphatidate phosphatase APP1
MIRNSSSDKEAKTIDCFWVQASRSTARIVNDVDQTVPLTYLNRLPGERMDAVLAHVAERHLWTGVVHLSTWIATYFRPACLVLRRRRA